MSYSTNAGGSATDGGACGGAVDYVGASGTLSWANSDSAVKTFDVPVCDDSTDESDETIVLTMNAPGNATLGATTVHTVTITDNADDVLPTVQFTALNQAAVAETGGPVTVTATPGRVGESGIPARLPRMIS